MPDAWIRQWGDPALHQRARVVTSFNDLLRARARRLATQLVTFDGAGLAATQVGSLQRLFAYLEDPEGTPRVLVNPEIVWRSSDLEVFLEGCLSFNTVAVEVVRPIAVEVHGVTPDGDQVELSARGHFASLLQHEIDHLDGILTIDRAAPDERQRVVAELNSRQLAA